MFAVFAEAGTGNEVTGRGFTPQVAWDNMLEEFALEEIDIDLDSVRFFVETDIVRETKITWQIPDTDDE
jgi:hypothetical protein